MKLNRKSLIELIKLKNNGWTSYQVKKKVGVSVRRIDQIYRKYKETGIIPELGKRIGRHEKTISKRDRTIIKQTYEEYYVCASRLNKLIKKDYNVSIPTYTIHKIMLELGFAKLNGRKDVRKKTWIRYERRHSLTAIHMDWGYDEKEERWFLPVIDDSSRKLLSLIECESPTTDKSIEAVEEALKHGEIQQCITDHGTQFCKGADDKARFPASLEKHGIKHILCRIKHPQSNGKSEKFNHLYKIHRHRYKTKEEFINWYNNIRPHMSLDEITPEEAYQKRKKGGRKYHT